MLITIKVLVFFLYVLGTAGHSEPSPQWSNKQTIVTSINRGYASPNPKVLLSKDGKKATSVWVEIFLINGKNTYLIRSASATIDGNIAKWGSPYTLESLSEASLKGFDAALSENGDKAIVVWARQYDQYKPTNNFSLVYSVGSIIRDTATWSEAKTIASGSGSFESTNPEINISSDGNQLTAMWVMSPDGHNSSLTIQSASGVLLTDKVYWGNITNIASYTNQHNIYGESIALSSDGTKATAVWVAYWSSAFNTATIQSSSAIISGSSAIWGEITDVSASGIGGVPSIALNDKGTKALVTWIGLTGTPTESLISTTLGYITGQSSSWGIAVPITSGTSLNGSIGAISSDGTKATAVWERGNGRSNGVLIEPVAQSASATITDNRLSWSVPQDISTPGSVRNGFLHPSLELSSDGMKAIIAWGAWDYGAIANPGLTPTGVIQTSSSSISANKATWTSPETLSGIVNFPSPSLSMTADGAHATAVWSSPSGNISLESYIESSSAKIDYKDSPSPSPIPVPTLSEELETIMLFTMLVIGLYHGHRLIR